MEYLQNNIILLTISLVSNVSKLFRKLASRVSQLKFTMATRVLETRVPCASSAEVENYPHGTRVFPKEQITTTSNPEMQPRQQIT